MLDQNLVVMIDMDEYEALFTANCVALMIVAIYWGVERDFIDFWDAFLWLAGFFLIELNVLNWQKESQAGVDGGAVRRE